MSPGMKDGLVLLWGALKFGGIPANASWRPDVPDPELNPSNTSWSPHAFKQVLQFPLHGRWPGAQGS